MSRLLIAINAAVGVRAEDLAMAWELDDEAAAIGPMKVVDSSAEVLLPGVVELVALPIALNVASNVLYDLLRRLLSRGPRPTTELADFEFMEATTDSGDRVVIVRVRSTRQ